MTDPEAQETPSSEGQAVESSAEPEGQQGQPEASPEQVADEATDSAPRKRVVRAFPAASFEESLTLPMAIQQHASGQQVRRLTLFNQMGRSPDSGPGRQLVINSNAYSLTTGSYRSEYIALTELGAVATAPDVVPSTRLAARFQLAIANIAPFAALYERYKDQRLPAPEVLRDAAIESGVSSETAAECVETFLANARDLGLLRTFAGAERVISFDVLLEEEFPGRSGDEPVVESAVGDRPDQPSAGDEIEAPSSLPAATQVPRSGTSKSAARLLAGVSDFSRTCFIISPIGAPESIERKHADLVFGSLVQPALQAVDPDIRLIRSDRISVPGVITKQIIEHLVRAPLVIADLSYSNPNVFYELALRHACRRPVVQLLRQGDPLPFDVGQFRTVTIDMSSIYTLVPQLDLHRAEIARQCRAALEEDESETPLSMFYPSFWDQFKTLPPAV